MRRRADGICERCKRHPIHSVHHLTYIRKYNERLDDLRGLCKGCHAFTHNKADHDPLTEPMVSQRDRYPRLPQPLDTERKLLRYLIAHPEQYVLWSSKVQPEMFSDLVHWHVADALISAGYRGVSLTRDELLEEWDTPPVSWSHEEIDAIYSAPLADDFGPLLTEFEEKSTRYHWADMLATELSFMVDHNWSVEQSIESIVRAACPYGTGSLRTWTAMLEQMAKVSISLARSADHQMNKHLDVPGYAIRECEEAGVDIWVEDGNLYCAGPKDAFWRRIFTQVGRNRKSIIAYFAKKAAGIAVKYRIDGPVRD